MTPNLNLYELCFDLAEIEKKNVPADFVKWSE